MSQKPKRSIVGRYVLPIEAIGRAASSLGEARSSIANMLVGFRNGLPDRRDATYGEGDLRGIKDPCERFDALADAHGWTAQELAEQKHAVRRTKQVALVLAVLSFFSAIASMFMLPIWTLVLVVPVAGCVTILGAAQNFKFALYETQLELRSLISARDFASMPDFLGRLIR